MNILSGLNFKSSQTVNLTSNNILISVRQSASLLRIISDLNDGEQRIFSLNSIGATKGQFLILQFSGANRARLSTLDFDLTNGDIIILYFDGSSWINFFKPLNKSDFLSKNQYSYFQDFNNNFALATGFGDNEIISGSSGAGASIQNSGYSSPLWDGRIGVVNLLTGTTTTGTAGANGSSSIILDTGEPLIFDNAFNFPILPNVTQNFRYIGGLIANRLAGNPTNGVYFRYDATNAQISCVCRRANVETAVNSGISVVANAWYDVRFIGNNSLVYFYINNILVATINTNLPNIVGSGVGIGFYLQKLAGTTSRSAFVDYIGLKRKITR